MDNILGVLKRVFMLNAAVVLLIPSSTVDGGKNSLWCAIWNWTSPDSQVETSPNDLCLAYEVIF